MEIEKMLAKSMEEAKRQIDIKQEKMIEQCRWYAKIKNKDYIGIWSSGCSDIRTGKEEGKLQEDRLPNLGKGSGVFVCKARHWDHWCTDNICNS